MHKFLEKKMICKWLFFFFSFRAPANKRNKESQKEKIPLICLIIIWRMCGLSPQAVFHFVLLSRSFLCSGY